MALKTQLKKKIAPKSATVITVDRLVELKKLLVAMKPTVDEYEKLVKELREKAMEKDPEQVVVFEGTDHNVTFGKAEHTRTLVDLPGAKKALGNDVFFEIAKVNLGDLDKYLTPEELDPLIETGYGSRKIDIVER